MKAASGGCLTAACLSMLVVGCGVESPVDLPTDLRWTSPHFVYQARSADAEICDELLATLEDHFDAIQSRLGFDWPAGRTVRYYKFADSLDYLAHSPCPAASGGCCSGANVFSYRSFQQHELVHAYLDSTGAPPPLIAEGTAVALSCSPAIPETPTLSFADALSFDLGIQDPRIYETGGRLVRYLLDTYGPEPFLRLYRDLKRDADFDELDLRLRSIYGIGADDLWLAMLRTPASCPQPYACSRPGLPLDGTPVAVAPVCALGSDQRTFALAAASNLALASPQGATVASCDAIPSPRLGTTTWAGPVLQVGLLQMEPGHYALDFDTTYPATPVAATVPARPWLGADCAALAPYVVAATEYPSLSVAFAAGQPTSFVKLRFQGPHLLAIYPGDMPTAISLKATVCPACDSTPAQCQSANLDTDPMNVLWDGDYVLRVDTPDASLVSRIHILGR